MLLRILRDGNKGYIGVVENLFLLMEVKHRDVLFRSVINVTETVVPIIELVIMKNEFWNKRYEADDTVYGKEPNEYFKSFIDGHKPGSILLPAEGEGRNAIYAAKKGWKVDAFDFSPIAQQKAPV